MATSPKGKQPDKAQKLATGKKGAGIGACAAKSSKPQTPMERVEGIGIDRIAEMLANGVTLTAIAKDAGVSIGFFLQWIAADDDRSARAREARTHAAKLWDEKALDVIEQASDPFELQRARELAQHYRWRASKTAPRDYGEKTTQEVTGENGGPVQHRVALEFVRPLECKDGV